eukprot:GEMP01069462.1.p1 GENE.GEMP01069462.1~~GEMP01069462.1.p1  ORF type:complete len:206 (+),score=55.75 GEMP01069462.1:347-964(+)
MMRPALTPGVWDVIDNPDDLNEFSIATDENGIEPATRIIDGGESVQLPKPTRVHGVMQLHPTVHKAPWSLATYYAQRAMEADHDAAWKNKVVQEIASQVGQASNRAGKAALAARHYYLQSIAADAKDMLSSLRQFCRLLRHLPQHVWPTTSVTIPQPAPRRTRHSTCTRAYAPAFGTTRAIGAPHSRWECRHAGEQGARCHDRTA